MQTTSFLSHVNSCQLILNRSFSSSLMRLFASIPSARINALSSSSVSDFFQLEAVNLSAAFQENRNKS